MPASDRPLFGPRWALPSWLVPPPDRWPIGWFVLALALVWVIGTLVRVKWLFDFGFDTAPIQWHGVPLLTSSDGYYFAAGVEAAVTGDAHGRTRIPDLGGSALVAFGWLAVKVFGASVDGYCLWFPALFAPAIAVPLAAIGRALQRSALGLAAGLAAVLAPGFFMRSAAGYFDSDTFAIVVPLIAIACVITQLVRPDPSALRARLWGIAGAATLAAYPFFYDQGGPVGMTTAAVIVAYLLLFHRKDAWAYPLIAALGIGQLTLAWPLCVALAVAVGLGFGAVKLPTWAARALPLVLCAVGFLLSPTWHQLFSKFAVFTGSRSAIPGADGGPDGPPEPVFKDTTRFVAEAQKIALADIGARVLGWLPLSLFAGLGAMLAVMRQRALLLLGPIAAVGLFSIIGGLRFTIYLSPVAALGAAWLACALAGAVGTALGRSWLRWAATAAVGLAIAIPGLAGIWDARPRPAVVAPEVAALDELGKRIQPGDVVVGWWDYGYAIGYFARARTIVDGGRRYQDANVVAEMLAGSSQHAAANLARLITARIDQRPDVAVAPYIFREAKKLGLGPATYLASLAKPDSVVPPVDSDIYFYLPARMMAIMPALDQLRPVEKGQKRPPVRGAPPVMAKADGERLLLPGGTIVDGKTMTLKSARGERPLKRIFSIAGGGVGKATDVRTREGNPDAATNGIFLRGISIFSEMDDRLMSSVFVQLFAFERPDPALFELVFANDAAKIYRLRR
ncbi:MAG: STT3 domain-containing protein [Myxococcota bacterium]